MDDVTLLQRSTPPPKQQGRTCRPFIFLDLPAEIRLMIYEPLLTITERSHRYIDDEENALVAIEKVGELSADFLRHIASNAELHGNILSTCKQINAEATTILYGKNAFVTCVHVADLFMFSSIQHTMNQLRVDLIQSFSLVFRSRGWSDLVPQVYVVGQLLANMISLKRLDMSIIIIKDLLCCHDDPATWFLVGMAVTSVSPGVEVVAAAEVPSRTTSWRERWFPQDDLQKMIDDIQAYASQHGKDVLSFEDCQELASKGALYP
ncbi:hypothetical protein F4678DRAFT_427662 [Xylaria arbuscula]|nr:hypothetical protein F4678DRAFT_427662 [Xylaria arbuscula]